MNVSPTGNGVYCIVELLSTGGNDLTSIFHLLSSIRFCCAPENDDKEKIRIAARKKLSSFEFIFSFQEIFVIVFKMNGNMGLYD